MLEILKLYFKDQKTRGTNIENLLPNIYLKRHCGVTVSSDAVKLTNDMIHLFILG